MGMYNYRERVKDVLKEKYVTISEASEVIGKSISLIGKLCRQGRFEGAEKLGVTGWVIPKESLEKYAHMKRGPKSRKDKLAAEREELLKKLNK